MLRCPYVAIRKSLGLRRKRECVRGWESFEGGQIRPAFPEAGVPGGLAVRSDAGPLIHYVNRLTSTPMQLR